MATYSLNAVESAANKTAATTSVQEVNNLLTQTGEDTEIKAVLIGVNFGVEYRQPSGSTYTETEFKDKLKELGLIPQTA